MKITIEIKQNDLTKDSCNVEVKTQKDLSKTTDGEKTTGAVVYNTICEALKNLK